MCKNILKLIFSVYIIYKIIHINARLLAKIGLEIYFLNGTIDTKMLTQLFGIYHATFYLWHPTTSNNANKNRLWQNVELTVFIDGKETKIARNKFYYIFRDIKTVMCILYLALTWKRWDEGIYLKNTYLGRICHSSWH